MRGHATRHSRRRRHDLTVRQFSRAEIHERLRSVREAGRPIVMGGAGIGLVAKAAERGERTPVRTAVREAVAAFRQLPTDRGR